MVAVAQLVRAPGCGPGGRGFKSPRSPRLRHEPLPVLESVRLHFGDAPLAQWQSNGLLIRRFRVRIPGGAPLCRCRGSATSLDCQRFQCRTPFVGDLIDPLLERARIYPDDLDRAGKAAFDPKSGTRCLRPTCDDNDRPPVMNSRQLPDKAGFTLGRPGLGTKQVTLVVVTLTGHGRPAEIASTGAAPALNNFSASSILRISSTVCEPRTTIAAARRGTSVCGQTKSLAVRAANTKSAPHAISQRIRHLVRTAERYLSDPRRIGCCSNSTVRRLMVGLDERLLAADDNATLEAWEAMKAGAVHCHYEGGAHERSP